jgi:two-component system cell cycle sensor histidine kinase/response regulator CckA
MVYGIVKQSGGFVFVDSRLGQGSCFEILLPVQEAADRPLDAPAAPAAPDRPARLSEGVILLVEDEPPVRAFAARALRLRGHSVLEADTAEEALRILQDPALQVDVFVTDVVMPGLDGPSWVSEALKTRPEVRVVFVSGYAEDCLADVQDRLPGSVFLPKPFSLVDLTQTVQRQLEAEAQPQPVPA